VLCDAACDAASWKYCGILEVLCYYAMDVFHESMRMIDENACALQSRDCKT